MCRKTELTFLSPEKLKSLHRTLGKKSRKNRPKACSKHVWTLLETILGTFGILNFFDFFGNFRKPDPPGNTGQKKFSINLPQNMLKTRLHTFGNDFVQLWNCEFFWFFEEFPRLDPPWNSGQKFLSKRKPQNTFGHLGTILDNFRTLKFFCFFLNIFYVSTSNFKSGKLNSFF